MLHRSNGLLQTRSLRIKFRFFIKKKEEIKNFFIKIRSQK